MSTEVFIFLHCIKTAEKRALMDSINYQSETIFKNQICIEFDQIKMKHAYLFYLQKTHGIRKKAATRSLEMEPQLLMS